MSDQCRSCQAPVWWLEHATTGKRAPIDADPMSDGNIRVDPLARTYRVLNQAQRELARVDGSNLYTNHFATCPDQAAWKGRTRAGRA